MAIDASIISGIRAPQFTSPQELYAAKMGIDQNELANRLGNLKLQEAERGVSENNALNAAYSGAMKTDGTLDRNMLYSKVAGSGLGAKIPGLQKSFMDTDKAAADFDKSKLEAAAKRIDLTGQAFGGLRQNPTPENAMAVIDHLGQNGVYTPEQVAQHKAKIAAEPGRVAEMADLAFRAALGAKEQLAKYETRNTGGTTDTLAIDPVTGKTKVVNTVQNTQSPDNKATVGASYANAAATREVAKATRDAASIQRDQATEMKLADDYRAQSKSFKEVGDAYKQISATLDKATTSPAATLAAATKFMKLLDPGSVVRESELGMALAATGVLDRATNYVNTLKYGKVLTPAQTADFKNITSKIYEAAQSQQKAIDGNYRKQAETYKLRPEMIVQDLGQNTPTTTPKPAAPLPKGWSVEVN